MREILACLISSPFLLCGVIGEFIYSLISGDDGDDDMMDNIDY